VLTWQEVRRALDEDVAILEKFFLVFQAASRDLCHCVHPTLFDCLEGF
jgi:hypothetical protein